MSTLTSPINEVAHTLAMPVAKLRLLANHWDGRPIAGMYARDAPMLEWQMRPAPQKRMVETCPNMIPCERRSCQNCVEIDASIRDNDTNTTPTVMVA